MRFAPAGHPYRKRKRLAGSALAVVLVPALTLTSCGHDAKKPVGPDVRGLTLPDAEASLKKANVGFTEHAKDAALGIIIKSNFVVCSESYVNKHMVRLEVAKHGC